MKKYYDKSEENRILHVGCFIPICILAISFLLISLAHRTKEKNNEYVNKNELQSSYDYSINNHLESKLKLHLKLYREFESFSKELPKRIDNNTIIENVELTNKEVTFKYSVNDYNENVDKIKYQRIKRKIEREMLIYSLQEYKDLDLTFNFLYHNELGKELFNFKLYTNYINKELELYEINGDLYNIPYNKEADFLKRYPNAKIPIDTTGIKYTYQDALILYQAYYQTIIFNFNEQKYKVEYQHIDSFSSVFPNAYTIAENDGKSYRVYAGDYKKFIKEKLLTKISVYVYSLNGKRYLIPDSVVADFEKSYPEATMAYQDGEDIYDIRVEQREEFLKQFPNAKPYLENGVIFESNGRKWNIPEEYIDAFMKENPEAFTVVEKDGKRYRVDIGDYKRFKASFSTELPKHEKTHASNYEKYSFEEESITQQSFEQDTRWSQKDCIYSDFKHGFSWQLPMSDWKLTTGNEKHTVFKVVEANTGLTAFVNINPIETNKGFSEDIFRIYDKMVQMEEQLEARAQRVTGQKTIQNNRKKALFGGKNAIKRRYITELIDDRYNDPLRVITYTYTFIYNKAIWSVTLKCHKQVYDLLLQENLELEGIFKGFHFINIQ